MQKKLTIEGMSCGHCVMHTEKALRGLEGVDEVKVDLNAKSAIVTANRAIPDEEFKKAVADAGYSVTAVE